MNKQNDEEYQPNLIKQTWMISSLSTLSSLCSPLMRLPLTVDCDCRSDRPAVWAVWSPIRLTWVNAAGIYFNLNLRSDRDVEKFYSGEIKILRKWNCSGKCSVSDMLSVVKRDLIRHYRIFFRFLLQFCSVYSVFRISGLALTLTLSILLIFAKKLKSRDL